MQALVTPPFPGPVAIGGRDENPIGVLTVLAVLALGGLGVGAAVAGRRKIANLGRLECAYDRPVVGVPLDYTGDWWTQRGRSLYRQALAAEGPGPNFDERVAKRMIALDVGEDSYCLDQFPPHETTDPRNVELWSNLVKHVSNERARPGTKPADA